MINLMRFGALCGALVTPVLLGCSNAAEDEDETSNESAVESAATPFPEGYLLPGHYDADDGSVRVEPSTPVLDSTGKVVRHETAIFANVGEYYCSGTVDYLADSPHVSVKSKYPRGCELALSVIEGGSAIEAVGTFDRVAASVRFERRRDDALVGSYVSGHAGWTLEIHASTTDRLRLSFYDEQEAYLTEVDAVPSHSGRTYNVKFGGGKCELVVESMRVQGDYRFRVSARAGISGCPNFGARGADYFYRWK